MSEYYDLLPALSVAAPIAFIAVLVLVYIGAVIFRWIDDAPMKDVPNPIISWMMEKCGFTRRERYDYISWRDKNDKARDPFFLILFTAGLFAAAPWALYLLISYPVYPCAVGTLFGLAYLARIIRRANKAFKKHVETPADLAHSKPSMDQ